MLSKNYSTIEQFYKTAGYNLTRESKSTFDMYKASKLTNLSPDRPNTSFFLVHRLNRAAHPKQVQFADKTQIESVEHDLQAAFKPDLSNYLQKKFRNFLVRKHQSNPPKPNFVTLNNPEMLNAFCSKMEVSLQLDSKVHPDTKILKPHRTVETAYLLNAKQRISRLVQMKRERQSSFSKLRETIKERCNKKKKKFGIIGPQPLNTVKEKEMNQQLKSEYQHLVERYRERISNRSKGKNFKLDQTLINQ